MLYLNVVGYKEDYFLQRSYKLYQLYLNVVGYKVENQKRWEEKKKAGFI